MRLASWNTNLLTVRLSQVVNWLAANPTDASCLQELKLSDDKLPRAAFQQAGYQSAVFGHKTCNDVAIASRWPVRDVVTSMPGFTDGPARVIAAMPGTPHGEPDSRHPTGRRSSRLPRKGVSA